MPRFIPLDKCAKSAHNIRDILAYGPWIMPTLKGTSMRVIAGISRGTRLTALPGDDITRPTVDRVKEGMFSALHFILEGASVLDLCAGSGQLGIEALSRGAKKCVFIDENREAVDVIRQNLKAAGLVEKASVAQLSAQAYLAGCKDKFDVILLDPPYHHDTVTELLPAMEAVLLPSGMIVAETERGAPLPEVVGKLTLKKQYLYGKVGFSRYEMEAEF